MSGHLSLERLQQHDAPTKMKPVNGTPLGDDHKSLESFEFGKVAAQQWAARFAAPAQLGRLAKLDWPFHLEPMFTDIDVGSFQIAQVILGESSCGAFGDPVVETFVQAFGYDPPDSLDFYHGFFKGVTQVWRAFSRRC